MSAFHCGCRNFVSTCAGFIYKLSTNALSFIRRPVTKQLVNTVYRISEGVVNADIWRCNVREPKLAQSTVS